MGAGIMNDIKEKALLKTDLSDFKTCSIPSTTPGVEIVILQTQGMPVGQELSICHSLLNGLNEYSVDCKLSQVNSLPLLSPHPHT